ncbi:hypothetical protein [Flavisolibacter nicotianae]|uniref:hypothetical protein n=1 Tax=Flavisolibacter nicotianae TaxID=2364882 RepID=UPI000EB51115|nr:hypothetical protein [Flavisolibacter nicotianae]
MKRILSIAIIFTLLHHTASSQGCVAIRNNGAACTMMGYHYDADHKPVQASPWNFAINSRYFKSYKHFVGTEEQKERVEAGTEVINHSFSTELGLTRQLGTRWSLALFAPFISNTRSSMYEHYGNTSKSPNARRDTRSFGLGDVRVAAYYWLVDPAKLTKANIQIGAGIKLPTGDYRYQDFFWRNDSSKVLGPVDQSIQLGDGGTGFTLEANTYLNLSKHTSLYANGFYLFNPREQNGVSTARGGVPAASAIAYGSDVMSVPDQFMARIGASYAAERFSLSGGMRIEGVPAKDVFGGSNGFRRPGYVLSAEPVVAYHAKAALLYLSVPVAIVRDRIQSVPDKIRTEKTGVYAQGDAAFADYTINVGVSFPLR